MLVLAGALMTITVSGTSVDIDSRLNRPQPTLYVFAGTRSDTLNPSYMYNDVGRELADKGWLIVTIDLPCHGEDARAGEPTSLDGWRYRHETLGEDFVGAFATKVRGITDYLIANRYSRKDQIFIAGTSRGGFLAAHCAIADPRIRGFVGFAPVTTVLALSEYANSNFQNVSLIPSMSLHNYGDKLSRIPFVLYSGPSDTRVGTQNAVNLMGALALDALGELKIMPATNHTVPLGAHQDAAKWLQAQVKRK